MTIRTITDRLSGSFLIGMGVPEDSNGERIIPGQTYLIKKIEPINKFVIVKSYVLSEANQN